MNAERPGLEIVDHDGEILAIIIRSSLRCEGTEFFTPDTFSQQLGFIQRPRGATIPAQRHRRVGRVIDFTQEVLFVRSGRLGVDLFDSEGNQVDQRELGAGDVILLAAGGHGFTMLEDTELIEVKQGPYAGVEDKEHF